MSATVYWQPMNGVVLDNAQSQVMNILKRTFGDDPTTIDESDMGKLEALASYYDAENGLVSSNPFRVLYEAVGQHGQIRIWAEY